MNYTKIRVVFKDWSTLYISEEEVDVFKLSRDYRYIEYLNDNESLHRLDGPAFEGVNGYKAWWRNDKRHRLDGPAIERPNGNNEWWVGGRISTKEQVNRKHNK